MTTLLSAQHISLLSPRRRRLRLLLALAPALVLLTALADGADAMGMRRGGGFGGMSQSNGMYRPSGRMSPTDVGKPRREPGKMTGQDTGTQKPRHPRRPPTVVRVRPILPITPQYGLPPSLPPSGITAGPALPPSVNLPLGGEQRFVPDEVLVSFISTVSSNAVVGIAQGQRLALLGIHRLPLIDTTLYRFRITDGRSVPAVIAAIGADRRIGRVQPNYLYAAQQDLVPSPAGGDPAQYALAKLDIAQAHGIARGGQVRIAVIDSSIDLAHADLAGVVVARFDAVKTPDRADRHGTAMASAIAAHGRLLGIAPAARILAARAFDPGAAGTRGTTTRVLDSLQWASDSGARIVNMSFAGPADPRLRDMLVAARRRGLVLIAAAGNEGPTAPPAYPAAYPEVIAVTATDAADNVFARANRGDHLALAAPGVDILVAAPGGNYDLTNGTSVAAAHVSGLAALLLERRPDLTPDAVRAILIASAKDIGAPGRDNDTGAGLANANDALGRLLPQTAERSPAN